MIALRTTLREWRDVDVSVWRLPQLLVQGAVYGHSVRDELYQGRTRGFGSPGRLGRYVEYARRFEYREFCSAQDALATLNNKLRTVDIARLHAVPTTVPLGAGVNGRWWLREDGRFVGLGDLSQFVAELPEGRMMLKPIDARWADGVRITRRARFVHDVLAVGANRGLMVERLEECGLMDLPISSPVPTVRVVTYRPSSPLGVGAPVVLGCVLRIGKQGAAADNLATGGGAFPVNVATGAVSSGLQLNMQATPIEAPPSLSRATVTACVEIALAMHNAIPGLSSAGWDVGLTRRGPILLEGNSDWGIDLLQAVARVSMRDRMSPARAVC